MNESRKVMIGRTLLVMIGFALCLVVLGGIVPKFEEVYESVEIPMPEMTVRLMALSNDFRFFPPIFIALAAVASWRIAIKGSNACALAWIGFALFGGFCAVALFLPLIGLSQGIAAR